MRKKLLPIIIGFVVLLAMGTGLYFLLQIPEEPSESCVITDRDFSLFRLLTVKSDDFDEYTINIDSNTGAFYFSMGETLPALPNSLEYAAVNVCKLTASRDLGETDDLKRYGLDKPKVQITAVFNDGLELYLNIGNPVQGADSENYITVGESNRVYTASIYPLLMQPQKNYLTTTILNEVITDPDTGETIPGALEKATITGTNYDKPIDIIQNPDHSTGADYYDFTFMIDSPFSAPAGGAQITKLDDQLSFLEATEAVIINPTAEELEQYGLAEPQAIVTFTTHGTEATLSAGKIKGDLCYVMLSDVSAIFSVMANDISSWLNVNATDFIADEIFMPRIDLLSHVEIAKANDNISFEIIQIIGSEGEINFEIRTGGKVIDTEKFRQLYLSVTGLRRNGALERLPQVTGDPAMTITYTYIEDVGRGPHTLSFFPSKASNDYFVKSGGTMLYVTCSRTDVQALFTEAAKLR